MDYLRALLIRIHVVLGLIGGLFFVLFGITGAILAYRPSIEATFLWPKATTASSRPGGLGPAVTAVLSAHPQMKVREVRYQDGLCWDIVLHQRDGSGARSVYVDPGTGTVRESRLHTDSWLHTLYRLHTDWMLGKFGLQLASRFGLLLLVQAILGLLVWSVRGHPFHLHALLGLTAGIGAALLAYSGWRVLTVPVAQVTPVVTLRGVENVAPLDQLVQTAEKRRAGQKLAAIYFPQAPSQPFQFWFGQRATDGIVYMDPYGAVIPMMIPPASNAALDWHSGPAGGGLLRLLRFLAGFGVAGLFVTGLLRRFRKA
jgi:uncharacterized iron-regulated membrane protein